MGKLYCLLLWALLPFITVAQNKVLNSSPPLVITHVSVIDMVGEAIKPYQTIVISGNKITAIQDSRKAKIPSNARVLNAQGKFLMPGLWDMHVHIRETENISFPLLLANGVTGIREMHYPGKCTTIGQWKDSLNKGNSMAPRIGAAAGCIIDGPGDNRGYGFIVATTEEQARQQVRQLKQNGADFIKVYSRLPLSTYQAIAAEAKKQGIPIAGHLPISIPAATCSNLGQKSFEHLEELHSSFSREEALIKQTFADSLHQLSPALFRRLIDKVVESYDAQKVVALAQVLKKNNTFICPTLILSHIIRNRHYLSEEGRQRLAAIPAGVNQMWKPAAISPRPVSDSIFLLKLYEREKQILKLLHQEGVNLISGTDASPIRYVVPGYSLHEELRLYVEAGLRPYEALKTATINPAKFLNRTHELGTVEAGKLADLVLLDANPLEDISHIQKVQAVILNGKLIQRQNIDRMLQQAEVIAAQQKR